jgi:GntR family transcriptional regulator
VKHKTPTFSFHLAGRSGVPPYLQLIQQVHQALRLGVLLQGDQLPTVKEVSASVAVNPNTVHKAYRELEYEGLVEARPGRGTFVTRSLATEAPGFHDVLRQELEDWLERAYGAGLDQESVEALIAVCLRSATAGDPA